MKSSECCPEKEDNLCDPENASQSPEKSPKSLSELEAAIERLSRSKDEIVEKLQTDARHFSLVKSALLSKVEAKEKELRYFLTPRSSGPDSDGSSSAQPVTTMAPIQSTVPAVRHVPTLIGGLTKSVDGLLGPANIPYSSSLPTGTSSNLNLTATSYATSPNQLGSKPGANLTGRSLELRKGTSNGSISLEADEPTAYTKVPVDAAVNLVLSRLSRAQNNCNALVTSNQTELQSFTFTQNSQNGKLIMMRVRVLEQENEELAMVNRTGRAARLETEIALRRRFVQDLKQTHSDLTYLVEEAEAETEVFGSSLLLFQRRLNFAKASAQVLATELEQLDPGCSIRIFQEAGWSPFDDDYLLEERNSESPENEIGDGPQIEVNSPAASEHSTSFGSRSVDDERSQDSVRPTVPSLPSNRLKRSSSRTHSVSSDSTSLSPIHTKRCRSDPDSNSQFSSPTPCAHHHVKSPPPIPVDGPQRTFKLDRSSLTPTDNDGPVELTLTGSPENTWNQVNSTSPNTTGVFQYKPSAHSEDDKTLTSMAVSANGQLSFESS